MDTTNDVYNIISALQNLTVDELDRLRLKVLRRFGTYLLNIPDAPGPDDLLHETIEDLLRDKRRCPLQRVDLAVCIYKIVCSKVNNLHEKWKRRKITKVSVDVLEHHVPPVPDQEEQTALRENILARVADDSLLVQIVEYRLEHPEEEPIKAQKLAELLDVDIQDIYNANRRLKTRLKDMRS